MGKAGIQELAQLSFSYLPVFHARQPAGTGPPDGAHTRERAPSFKIRLRMNEADRRRLRTRGGTTAGRPALLRHCAVGDRYPSSTVLCLLALRLVLARPSSAPPCGIRPTAVATDWRRRRGRSCYPVEEEDGRDCHEDDGGAVGRDLARKPASPGQALRRPRQRRWSLDREERELIAGQSRSCQREHHLVE